MHSYPQKCAFLHNSFCVKDVKKSPPRHLSPALHSWTTLRPLSYKKSLNVPHILYHIACIRRVSCFGRIANASPLTPASSRHSDTFGYCILQMNQGGVWWRHVACLKKQLTPRGCVVKAVGALSSAVPCSPLPFPPSFVFVCVCALCLCAHVFTDICVYVVYVTWVITFGDTWELNPDPQEGPWRIVVKIQCRCCMDARDHWPGMACSCGYLGWRSCPLLACVTRCMEPSRASL
ncbi:hypothetical protein VOLCADRAFT_108336 [Volvox carteri f. nagariensis]|uniref:Uncharacterized protein n=1 Tax=Volvox carteri f. nagariensis TaxID=3068 RepID=D8UJJ1_VOLCA|nr:uncharacterized protein VOLCADRAFT_108336 [Volvox carteri f. nagariensis]EFJ40078.1 hypothetical protein VOLCADRAFT_108336 [Volvox carteri f. nagariensis]|eukprot:XP_002958827.1 hypothetical protein VOLCADRAFT_108336 [Volvox carteri f. nagariensis]